MDWTLLRVSSGVVNLANRCLAIIDAALGACVSSSQLLTLDYMVKVAVVMYGDCPGSEGHHIRAREETLKQCFEVCSI